MTSEEDNIKEKHFLVKLYPSLLQIEEAIRRIVQNNGLHLQLSVLGKLFSNYSFQKNTLGTIIKDTRMRLNTALGKRTQFGHFNSPEIGVLFIAGHLTETFLRKVDKKKLASLTVGLLGIFKGIGIELNDIAYYQKELQNGNFLLIIRGDVESLSAVESIL